MPSTQFRSFVRLVAATLLVSTVLAVVGETAAPETASAAVSDGWVQIDVGDRHTCGVTTVGEAFCWGNGNEGQLGDGTTTTLLIQLVPLEVPAPPGVTWTGIDVGAYHSCATTTDGDIYCWGVDDEGRLGNGNAVVDDFFPSPTLVDRPVGVSWQSVAAGSYYTCALTTDGDVYCFGDNDRGQLGTGDNIDRATPTQIVTPVGVTWASVEVGSGNAGLFDSRTACAVSTTGAGYCWGSDELGALGDGNGVANTNVPVLIDVPGGGSWASIRPGGRHTCGVTTTGDGYCWGRDEFGQLGNGPSGSGDLTPQPVSTPPGAAWSEISGTTTFTCGTTTAGDLYCWGRQLFGSQLGDGTSEPSLYDTPNPVVTPPTFPSGAQWVDVRVSNAHSCAVDSDGTGWCWGSDGWGNLGDDAPSLNKPVPSQVGDRTSGPQDMVFDELRDRALAEPAFSIRAQATSGLPVEFTAIGGCTVATTPPGPGNLFTQGSVTLVSEGVCEITATQPGDADWDAATPITRSFSIIDNPPPQTFVAGFIPTIVNPGGTAVVTFGLAHPIGTVPATDLEFTATFGELTPLAITANTCATGTAVLDAGVLTYSGGTLEIDEACGIGVQVTAPATAPSYPTSYAASGGYLSSNLGLSAVQGAASLLVALGSDLEQTITMPVFGNRPITDGPGPIPLGAIATSGLPVSYATTGPCTAVGDELTITGLGRCEITASQAGDSTYAAAPDQIRAFNIVQGSQTIDFAPLSDWPISGGVRTLTATASSGLPVSFFALTDTVCTHLGAEITIVGLGTCTVRADQFGDADYQPAASVTRSFEVVNASQTIDFAPLADWGLFDGERTIEATASSGLTVTFGTSGPCSIIGNVLSVSAVGTCTVTASQAGDASNDPALDVERSFDVLPGDQTIDFGVLGPWPVTDLTRPLSATATSGLPVSFAATGVCSVTGSTVTITGTGVCAVTASQSGNASYNAAPDVVRGFEVVTATQTIDFAPISDVGFQPTLTVAATASSGLDVSFSASGVCSATGSTLTLTGAGTCTVTASQAGDATFAAATPVQRTFEVLKAEDKLEVEGPPAATLVGAPATFVVVYETRPGYPEPTGVIRFQVVGGPSADVTMVNGVATWTLTDLPPGTNEVGGSYLGDDNYLPTPTISPASHVVETARLGLTGLPASVTPGDLVSVEASGFHAGEEITFVFNSDPVTVGVVTSSATGTATLTFAIPNVDAGEHQLTATGGTSGLVASASTTLQALAPTTTPPTVPPPASTPTTQPTLPDMGPGLPQTGSGLGVLPWALGLLVGGVLAVGLARRRRSDQHA